MNLEIGSIQDFISYPILVIVCVINHYEEFPSADSAVSSYFVYILGANLVTIVVFKFPRVLMVVNSFFIDTCHNLCAF